MTTSTTINLNIPNVSLENKPNLLFLFLKKIFIFTYKILRKIIHFIHVSLDKFVALHLYLLIRTIGEGLYFCETWMNGYLKRSKYVEDDRFDESIEHDRVIMLGMGLKNVKKITIREVARENGVSDGYARQLKHIAKNYMDYYHEYAEIWKNYTSDSEKRDKRSIINS